MLKKLIKYDFKALNRYLLLIHAFLLAAAAAVRIFLTEPFALATHGALSCQHLELSCSY